MKLIKNKEREFKSETHVNELHELNFPELSFRFNELGTVFVNRIFICVIIFENSGILEKRGDTSCHD